MIDKILGSNIKRLRQARDLTIKQVAEQLNVWIDSAIIEPPNDHRWHQSRLSNIENGYVSAKINEISDLAIFYNTSVEVLMKAQGQPSLHESSEDTGDNKYLELTRKVEEHEEEIGKLKAILHAIYRAMKDLE